MSTRWSRHIPQLGINGELPVIAEIDFPKWPSDMPLSEYNDIRIVSADVIPPMGFPFLSIKEPPSTVQCARDMTLASGRTLYEVWDFSNRKLLGFNIPTDILLDVREHREGLRRSTQWASLPLETQRVYIQTRQVVMDLFPNLPEPSSEMITDNLLQKSYRGQMSVCDVEKEVVDHAKHRWTNHHARVEQLQREVKQGVWKADAEYLSVGARVKAVLEEWMGEQRSVDFRERFFCKHLLVCSQRKIANWPQAKYKGGEGLRGHLVWCEDKKTIIGLNMGPKELGEKKVRLFL